MLTAKVYNTKKGQYKKVNYCSNDVDADADAADGDYVVVVVAVAVHEDMLRYGNACHNSDKSDEGDEM